MASAQKRLYRLIPNDQLENLIKKNNSDRCQQQQHQQDVLKPSTTGDLDSPQLHLQQKTRKLQSEEKLPIKQRKITRRRQGQKSHSRNPRQRRRRRQTIKWVEL